MKGSRAKNCLRWDFPARLHVTIISTKAALESRASAGKKCLVIFPVCRAVPTNVSGKEFLREHLIENSPFHSRFAVNSRRPSDSDESELSVSWQINGTTLQDHGHLRFIERRSHFIGVLALLFFFCCVRSATAGVGCTKKIQAPLLLARARLKVATHSPAVAAKSVQIGWEFNNQALLSARGALDFAAGRSFYNWLRVEILRLAHEVK